MTYRKRIVVGIVALGLLAAPAIARPHGKKGGHDGARRAIGAMLHGAELTDAQREQVRALLEERRGATADTRAALRAANEELQALLLSADPPADDQVRAVSERVAALRAELFAAQIETALAVRGLLTPEQLAAAGTHEPPCRGGKRGR